ncbi:MAG: hypothetical protein LBN71_04615, partial [Tannerella sp.]|nr:hypothetical protein [Tannerella sp.]
DLYAINIDNQEVEKIWELPNETDHFTNSNSMIIDREQGVFYALAYPNKRYASTIVLNKYQLDQPKYQSVGDSIPYFFNDVDSYCDLFQRSDQSELYTVTSHINDNHTVINIYSIAYPPVSPGEALQHLPAQRKAGLWLTVLFLCLTCLAGLLCFIYRRKKRNSIEQNPEESEEQPVIYEPRLSEKRPRSLNLLGNFQVINKEGVDISSNFTPTTTQLFLMLLLATLKNGRGCSSKEIKRMLWDDKDDDSARNNRNVYINKLRSILKSFDEIKILNRDSYWTVSLGETVFCDYERFMVLIKMLQSGQSLNKKLLNELLDITLKGKLLPYIQQSEWIEAYQAEYTTLLIESLLAFSKRDEVKSDLMALMKIADAILLHDNIDEDAIGLKCYALFHLGKKGQALQAYNKFSVDYEELLATKHNLSFENLVK